MHINQIWCPCTSFCRCARLGLQDSVDACVCHCQSDQSTCSTRVKMSLAFTNLGNVFESSKRESREDQSEILRRSNTWGNNLYGPQYNYCWLLNEELHHGKFGRWRMSPDFCLELAEQAWLSICSARKIIHREASEYTVLSCLYTALCCCSQAPVTASWLPLPSQWRSAPFL